jgi:peptide/nickel transport system substrate-binding protein
MRSVFRAGRSGSLIALLVAVSLVLAACSSESEQEPGGGDTTTTQAGATTTQGSSDSTAPTTQPAASGGSLVVAMDAEAATLDVHITTQGNTQRIGWHIFEGLFTVDENFAPTPMLVESYTYDDTSHTYTFELRQGVTFHDGTEFDAEDVVASMQRWLAVSFNGVQLARAVEEVRATGSHTVELEMTGPFAPAIQFLTFPIQGLGIYPSEVIEAAGDGDITTYVGTGPFEFVEKIPDVEVRLQRFEGYTPRSDEPSGMAGRREALVDQIVFRTVPEVSARRDMVITGEAHLTESLDTEMLSAVGSTPGVEPIIIKPYWSPLTNFNKQWGPTADVKVRQAMYAAMNMQEAMQAAFGVPDMYRLNGSTMFPETEWYSEAGMELYNQNDPERARQLLAESGYDGEPIIWLTTRDRQWNFVIATVIKQQLEEVGFNVQLEVVDIPTIGSRRAEREGWSAYDTANLYIPDPATWVILDSSVIGWWEDPVKDELVARLNSEVDHDARKAIWDELQAYIHDQVPTVQYGDFFALGAKREDVLGHQASLFPFYWNVSLAG